MMERARYFEPRLNRDVVTVLPGDHYVSPDREAAVMTLLGSCVAACIRDVDLGIGGLNHFLLPDGASAGNSGNSARYGVHAMEVLVNGIIRAGGQKSRMEAKVFGGANVLETSSADPVGARNGRFVTEYLRREGIRLVASDLGGNRARRVFYVPATGKATVNRIQGAAAEQTRVEEQKLWAIKPASGGLELF